MGLGLLHAVFAEDALSGSERRIEAGVILAFRDSDEGDICRLAVNRSRGGRDIGQDRGAAVGNIGANSHDAAI